MLIKIIESKSKTEQTIEHIECGSISNEGKITDDGRLELRIHDKNGGWLHDRFILPGAVVYILGDSGQTRDSFKNGENPFFPVTSK